jgi:hypothetical protein
MGASGLPPEQLSFRMEGSDTIIDIRHAYTFEGVRPTQGTDVTGDIIELEIDGEITIITLCNFQCDGAGAITNCTETGEGLTYFTVSYNLGEITGTPPKVRARTRRIQCGEMQIHDDYGPWSPIKDAIVAGPLPLVEIATVIGIGGIGVAVLNNYWSGRREQKMTEVTRTAAVDERFMELYDASRETEFQRTMAEVLYQYEWSDYDDFLHKYGPKTNVDAWAKIQSVTQYFEGIGVMVRTDSVSLNQVHQLLANPIMDVWEKLDDVILERRKRESNPTIYRAFEDLYYAMKNYQPQGTSKQDDTRIHRFEDE